MVMVITTSLWSIAQLTFTFTYLFITRTPYSTRIINKLTVMINNCPLTRSTLVHDTENYSAKILVICIIFTPNVSVLYISRCVVNWKQWWQAGRYYCVAFDTTTTTTDNNTVGLTCCRCQHRCSSHNSRDCNSKQTNKQTHISCSKILRSAKIPYSN